MKICWQWMQIHHRPGSTMPFLLVRQRQECCRNPPAFTSNRLNETDTGSLIVGHERLHSPRSGSPNLHAMNRLGSKPTRPRNLTLCLADKDSR